ncbi:uncharacterized protein N7511_010668 [Penicillium nucicola]|uniref:uncharacterized protein n=1 Tax=Penicillium nucicola TaxID=1850975 RepID=UPI002545135E|nr:uncharacterized protein N7511_010668 [Penicillium nucicola]KAJ5748972.1 hypothetical protein N7511_010668 [Penicillium nucicola]
MSDDSAPIAQEFLKFYYAAFESDRQQLAPLYRNNSKLSHEDNSLTGVEKILSHISSMPQVKRELVNMYSHYTNENKNAIMIMMHGHLLASDTQRMNFVHVFSLQQEPNGGFYIASEMYQLVFNA